MVGALARMQNVRTSFFDDVQFFFRPLNENISFNGAIEFSTRRILYTICTATIFHSVRRSKLLHLCT